MIDVTRYPASVFWSDEDSGYIAIAPDLPGCSAFGQSSPEALAELNDAIKAWVEAARNAGNPIPMPSPPVTDSGYSGKILLRMPKTLHAQLAQIANNEGISLNQQVVVLLAQAVTRAAMRQNASEQIQIYNLATTALPRMQYIHELWTEKGLSGPKFISLSTGQGSVVAPNIYGPSIGSDGR